MIRERPSNPPGQAGPAFTRDKTPHQLVSLFAANYRRLRLETDSFKTLAAAVVS